MDTDRAGDGTVDLDGSELPATVIGETASGRDPAWVPAGAAVRA